ncbi:MAG: FitA-like ribbon-helix-helix domain-containing protein [Longimicrobiales bacterium]
MAQILIRNVDGELIDWIRRRADRLGQSKEQLARAIIEREARAEAGWEQFQSRALRLQARLARRTGRLPDSTKDIQRTSSCPRTCSRSIGRP